MTYGSIDAIRTRHSNQCCDKFASKNGRPCRSGTYSLHTIWNFSSASISLCQNSATSRRTSYDSGNQEGFYRQVAFWPYRTYPSESAAKRKEHQRYCCRSAARFFIKEVIVCISAMNASMMWCLSTNSTVFTNTRLRRFMTY